MSSMKTSHGKAVLKQKWTFHYSWTYKVQKMVKQLYVLFVWLYLKFYEKCTIKLSKEYHKLIFSCTTWLVFYNKKTSKLWPYKDNKYFISKWRPSNSLSQGKRTLSFPVWRCIEGGEGKWASHVWELCSNNDQTKSTKGRKCTE